jgi:hypothetical protein
MEFIFCFFIKNNFLATTSKMAVLSGKSTVFGLTRFQCLVITEFLLIAAMGLMMASIFITDWRLGGSNGYMYPPNMTGGFESRHYGLIYVEGLRKMTWAELATSTCDQWGMYIETKPLFPIATPCLNAPVNKTECTNIFETHFYNRCNAYSSITLVSWITAGLMSLATFLCSITAIAMLLIPLGIWKRFVLAALGSSSLISFGVLMGWLITTTIEFHSLTSTASYPIAIISVGFWVALAGTLALILATFLFWRLSLGLKLVAEKGPISTSNAGLLDMAEHKLLGGQKIADDTDDESTRI